MLNGKNLIICTAYSVNLDSKLMGLFLADEQGGFLARVDTPDLIHTLGPAHRVGVLKLCLLLSLVVPQIQPC